MIETESAASVIELTSEYAYGKGMGQEIFCLSGPGPAKSRLCDVEGSSLLLGTFFLENKLDVDIST